ncbi:MAG TPA: GNAT family N-acetyltransferase [Kofleriaceae bacterium]|nr:GNAT family N-acetyltransferase [Kofleriaceae bacterium]
MRLLVRDRAHEALLARFYDELYLPAFAHQREPLDAWREQLWGASPAPYDLAITLALDATPAAGDLADTRIPCRIDGGIVGELYPASRCAILTYMVVAPHARGAGLGRALLDDARRELVARGARAVFAEVSDPAQTPPAHATEAHERLARFQRWGARVVDHPYVQPDLGYGRDRALRLIAFEPAGAVSLDGDALRAFLHEFYAVTERLDPTSGPARDHELAPLLAAIPDQVPLRRM